MKSKQLLFPLLLLSASLAAQAAPVYSAAGRLVGGGENSDNVVVRIELSQAEANKIKRAVCTNAASSDCADRIESERGKTFLSLFCDGSCINPKWLQPDSESGGTTLKPRYRNRNVRISFTDEPNQNRVLGASDDERFLFVKDITLLP